MKYEFEVYQMKVEDHTFWVAKSKALKGCVGQGETAADAVAELEQNEQDWLETAQECGIPIPAEKAHTTSSFSGKVSLRFSSFTHKEASSHAKEIGVSLNQYINDAIVYYNGIVQKSQEAEVEKHVDKAIEKMSRISSVVPFKPRCENKYVNILSLKDDMPEEM